MTGNRNEVRLDELAPVPWFCGVFLERFSKKCTDMQHMFTQFLFWQAVKSSVEVKTKLWKCGKAVHLAQDSLLILSDGNCMQSINHPGSVWNVLALSNGDIISGSSDAVARSYLLLWSLSFPRHLDQKYISVCPAWFAERAWRKGGWSNNCKVQRALSCLSLRVGLLERCNFLNSLDPMHWMFLASRFLSEMITCIIGKKDQETKVIKNNNVVEAYQWSASEVKWAKVCWKTNNCWPGRLEK
jgi:hypothetical protein